MNMDSFDVHADQPVIYAVWKSKPRHVKLDYCTESVKDERQHPEAEEADWVF